VKLEFLIKRQGKDYVLYAGLLDAAHDDGLSGIDTELVQVPNNDNGNVAICKATVYMSILDEDTWLHKSFMGIGDASPENVGRNIVPHIIRMAETRAKARALRDAVNVGTTALEELGDAPEGDAQAPASSGAVAGRSGAQDTRRPTDRQLNYLGSLIEAQGDGAIERFEAKYGKLCDLDLETTRKLLDRLAPKKEEG
jgi:hypothetical protein